MEPISFPKSLGGYQLHQQLYSTTMAIVGFMKDDGRPDCALLWDFTDLAYNTVLCRGFFCLVTDILGIYKKCCLIVMVN